MLNNITKTNKVVMSLALGLLALLIVATVVTQHNLRFQGEVLASYNLRLTDVLKADRGIIYDRNGKRLVENRRQFIATINTESYSQEEIRLIQDKLHKLLGTPQQSIKEQWVSGKRVRLVENISAADAEIVREEFPAIVLESYTLREYKYPTLYAHIIGYTGLASAEDIKTGYKLNDAVGKYRLERLYDRDLRGVNGRVIETLNDAQVVDSLPGKNLLLSIDHSWQQALMNRLAVSVNDSRAHSAAAMIMEQDTGEIYAYASYPSFDTNKIQSGLSDEEFQSLLGDAGQPFIDKVVGVKAAPGSTFKVPSTLALYSAGLLELDDITLAAGCIQLGGGYKFCDFAERYLGYLNLNQALQKSSNIYFCESIRNANPEQLDNYFEILEGLGLKDEPLLPGFEGRVAGSLSRPKIESGEILSDWFIGDSCNTVIGQGKVSITPAHLLQAVSTINNNGDVVLPKIVQRVVDPVSTISQDFYSNPDQQVETNQNSLNVNPQLLSAIRKGMQDAAQEPGGTGYSYFSGSYGNPLVKTGSAEASRVIDGDVREGVHGWVVGEFVHNGSEYTFVVHSHFGGGSASASRVMADFLACLGGEFNQSFCQ